MGLKKGTFVVAQTFSVLDPYDSASKNIIELSNDGDFAIVATVDVCVKNPQRTQVSLDSMAQIAVRATDSTFEVTYEILRNGIVIATINDEMDFVPASFMGQNGRHTNFPNFPLLLDNYPSAGINKYELRVTRVLTSEIEDEIFVASRSLKATVFTS
ncbi:hypothetical protein [Chengkuizengella sediminis]|uniref:hypothetical protein n=1 Tax=Chengkuizengella sediminis TaxID=1885917 RepID=UPI00138A39B0|nr:hypothetical protein [Chengkuizengella sediminis]NDI37176.1 hypothetical protein [Chengkuizengella sediminis]